MYRVFIKYCVFSKILKYIPDSALSWFPLSVSVCTQWQVKNQRCSRTCRVQKNHNILRKNTIFNEHPVSFINLKKIVLTVAIIFFISPWLQILAPLSQLCKSLTSVIFHLKPWPLWYPFDWSWYLCVVLFLCDFPFEYPVTFVTLKSFVISTLPGNFVTSPL